VKRAVFINTYWESQDLGARNLLDLIIAKQRSGLVEDATRYFESLDGLTSIPRRDPTVAVNDAMKALQRD
jgi:hypothetical protein